MTSSPQVAAVTPRGVREGQQEALEGLVARRGPAVLAYCREVCAPDVAPRAAAEAFARFRAAVHDAPDLAAVDPESLLISATRHAAASMARVTQPPPGGRRRRGARTETCALVPTLLAARAAGALGSADRNRLARHLTRCEGCRGIEEAFRVAELSYRHPPDPEVDPATSSMILSALTAAAPIGPLADDAKADTVDFALEPPPESTDDGVVPAEPEPEPEPQPEPEAAPAAPDALPAADAPVFLQDRPALPEEPGETAEDEDVEEFDDDWGSEEDEGLPPVAAEPQPGGVAAAAATLRGLSLPSLPSRPSLPPRLSLPAIPGRIALPVAVVALGLLVALIVSGFTGGSEPTPPVEEPRASERAPEPPVTTPLPVTVQAPATKPEPSTTPTTPETGTTTTPGATGTSGTTPSAALPAAPARQGNAGRDTRARQQEPTADQEASKEPAGSTTDRPEATPTFQPGKPTKTTPGG
jgi:hypothetical protein